MQGSVRVANTAVRTYRRACRLLSNRIRAAAKLSKADVQLHAIESSRATAETECIRSPGIHLLPKLGFALVMLTYSLCGGAVMINTVVDSDPLLCKQFFKMVKAAGMPRMTDEQLCDFRFARLPPSKTQGFTFPQWREIQVADPVGMYLRMIVANRAPHSVANPPQHLDAQLKAVKQAAFDHNLAFYKARLPMVTDTPSGSKAKWAEAPDVTFVFMDIRRCSSLPYMQEFPPVLYHAAFEGPNLQHPIPSDIGGAGEIALWNTHMPVLLDVSNHWIFIKGMKPGLDAGLTNLWWDRAPSRFDAALTGGSLCTLRIEK